MATTSTSTKIKVIFFDFMGTCLDWHSGIIATLPASIPLEDRSQLALEWRQDYFDYNAARLLTNQLPEDIDLTLSKTLNALLAKPKHTQYLDLFDSLTKQRCVKAWHSMPAWPDVLPALTQLHSDLKRYELVVFANGTTRLQLDLCRSSGLNFDMLLSSELLGVYKPASESYRKAMDLLQREPGECVMVAAHAYDTRGARDAGMRTVYVRRWTDDIQEDMTVVEAEHDFFLEDMRDLPAVIARL